MLSPNELDHRGSEWPAGSDEKCVLTRVRRGREVFSRFRVPLRAGAALLRLVPRGVSTLILSVVRHMPTAIGIALRYMLVARLARSCGDNVAVFEGAYLFELENMTIGSNVSIHQMCYLSAAGGLSIGNDVSIAHGTSILSSEHSYEDPFAAIRDARGYSAEVTISNDVWIGAGVRILAGVSIGEHCVVGAGAVVVRSVPAWSVAAGVPARVIKSIAT